MKEYHELRLSKAEFEKLLLDSMIAHFIINRDQKPKEKDTEHLYGLMIRANMEGLTDLVQKKDGHFYLTDKVLKKADKHLSEFNDFMMLEFAKDVEEDVKKMEKMFFQKKAKKK